MDLISRDELKSKLDAGDDFKLVMVLGEWAFRAKRIPGSLNVSDPTKATANLDPADEIVLYCSDENCAASKYAYHLLTTAGYTHVRRYAGGIAEWETTGMPLEGEWVEESSR